MKETNIFSMKNHCLDRLVLVFGRSWGGLRMILAWSWGDFGVVVHASNSDTKINLHAHDELFKKE